MRDRPARSGRALAIVGVGASAGGLDAMRRLVGAIPPEARLAIVYVQHLDPVRESLLVPLLAAKTRLAVVAAVDGIRIAAGHVYIAPPHTDVSLAAGTLRLAPREDRTGPARTIDAWFSSLAAERRHAAIGVVLSGTGDDGTRGAAAIHGAGGTVLAQDPRSASFDGMPSSAIAAGAVDSVLSAEEIGAELARLARRPRARRSRHSAKRPHRGGVEADPLVAIFDLLRTTTTVDFEAYKRPMVQRRIVRCMGLHGIRDLVGFATFLRGHPDALVELRRDLLIRVTGFFRDRETFRVLEDTVIPMLLEDGGADAPIRGWVPGCATGEEAYSIAMCLLEAVGNRRTVQLFATDVQQEVIEEARAGVYSAPRSSR